MKTQNFKSTSKNIAVFLMVLVTVISGYALVKADFSGDWALDTEKSTFPAPPGGGGGGGGGGRRGATKLKVTQTGATLTVVRTSAGMNGEVITTDNLTADGKESVSTGGREGSVRKVTAKWSDDQNTVTVTTNTTMSFQGGDPMTIPGKEVWSLSADGKVLTIDSESNSPMGAMTSKLVYNKQ
ncbi:MAG TPA: hypothetical protein VFE57_05310 [Cyclobacteriaceae bacterium]|jgi:hypothetical protein|nr:hypothetical protein [Cyclobacteriaceae bacterium]